MVKRNPNLEHRHLSAIRMLGYELKLGMLPERLQGLVSVWEARLTPAERASILAGAIACNDRKTAITLMEAACTDLSVHPGPAFERHLHDAMYFARQATKPQKAAYVTACFSALPQHEQQQFLAAAARAA